MSEPKPDTRPQPADTAEGVWAPWAPGARLMRAAGARHGVLLLAGTTLLPALAWLSTAMDHKLLPPQAWAWLLAPAAYLWICSLAASRSPMFQAQPLAVDPLPPAAARPSEPQREQAVAAADAASAQAEADTAATTRRADSPHDATHEQPAASSGLPPGDQPAASSTAEVEARLSGDEIARRVAAASSMFDACSRAAEQAAADVQAMLDEERHAQKVLATLRSRLMLLDQCCHALARAALGAQPSPPQRDAVEPLAEAATRQVLHCHQLAERLGAAERAHGQGCRRCAAASTGWR